jgi:ppGpp synthetase/RelA/SpoT-type nucleotidyltranferase
VIAEAPPDETGDLASDEQRSIEQAAREARQAYESQRGLYEAFADKLAGVLRECLAEHEITVHSVTHRAKDPESFGRKAAQLSPDNPTMAKYRHPLEDISDKAGVRVITYLLSTVDAVSEIVMEQFEVLERETKVSSEPDRFGYQSDHYLVKYSDDRATLPEYRRFSGLIAEIQVRTILQHSWAEIAHDIQYKAAAAIPGQVSRRFAALAGLIEIADREFQAIEDADRVLRAEARRNVDLGHLDQVEITGDSLRVYLNRRYGADGRMSDFSYQWTARLLLKLGFQNLAEVNECIEGWDDSQLSRIVYGSRQGQLTRFELVLLASMGENFILAHRFVEDPDSAAWYIPLEMGRLKKIKDSGLEVGEYRPAGYPEVTLRLRDLTEIVEAAEQAKSAETPPP